MPLNWKPEVWSALAKSKPEEFLRELSTQRRPTAQLFTATYLDCIEHGFRALKYHSNYGYETAFFHALTNVLPHPNAKKASDYRVDRVLQMDVPRAPIAFLQWTQALQTQLRPGKKFNYHSWLLALRKPAPERKYEVWDHERFSLDHAPEWAAGYTQIQRGLPATRLKEYLAACPISDCLGILNAAASLHAKESPAWLQECLEVGLSRTEDLLANTSVIDTSTAMHHAWAMPTPALDAALVRIVCEQSEGTNVMFHAWFGGVHWAAGHHNNMIAWWSRQSPQDRGAMLHRWFGQSQTWDNLAREVATPGRPGLAMDMFTREAMELTPSQAHAIVQAAPLERVVIHPFMGRMVPAMQAIEMMVEPRSIKETLLASWDMIHEKASVLSTDGLLDMDL